MEDDKKLNQHKACLTTKLSPNEFKTALNFDKNALNQTDTISSIFEKVSKHQNKSDAYKELIKLKKFKSLIARLLESYIYVKEGNEVKAKSILENIFAVDYSWYILNGEQFSLSEEKQLQMMSEVFDVLSEKLEGEIIFEALVFYLHYNTTGAVADLLKNKYSELNSLKEIRANYQSIVYANSLSYVWAPYLYNESSNKEYSDYLFKTLDLEKKILSDQDLLLFRDVELKKDKLKKKVIQIFKKLQLDQSLFGRLINIKILEDDFYNFISATTSLKLGLLQNQKRKLFVDLLKNSQAKKFALYNLFLIGDIDIKYLNEFHGSK